MKMQHGGLALELPSGWADRSTLLFIKLEPPERMPTLAKQDTSTEAISVTFASGVSPDEALEAQATQLREIDPHFEVLSRQSLASALGDGPSYTQRVTLGGREVTQLCAAWAVGNVVVLATAATSKERFARHEGELRTILASLRTTREA